ncbi:MlaD family protein [Cellvibrio sp. OA-2007]|uniref:MlaD family protein n=1 Tax=Cellvibrio sp. OA-2007 TaxID=529823 RepID=UPI000780E45E|nr:MlaD family protein [Cellvibrio sp. OA-2007]
MNKNLKSKKSKNNKALAIGAFIVGALTLIFFALIFFSGGNMFAQKERVIMYFEGSVQGLQIGAPIKLKGVIIGEITDIQINFDNNEQTTNKGNVLTAVTGELALKHISRKGTEVKREFFEEAINKGLRAQLNFQSFLTGLLYVELDFFPGTSTLLYGAKDDSLELPTVGTGFEEITKNLQELNLKGIAKNLEKLTSRLAAVAASGAIEDTLSSVQTAADTFSQAGQDVSRLSKNLDKTNSELRQLLANLNQQTPAVAGELKATMVRVQKSLDELDKATNSIHHSFSEDSPLLYQLNETLVDISQSAQAFRSLSETLDQQPEALLRGKQLTDKDE